MSLQRTRTYLITGCTRGIGRALAGIILQRPNTQLIGLVRDPTNDKSEALRALAKTEGKRVVLLQYDAADSTSAACALAQLHSEHPDIQHIDVAIANAGVAQYFGPSLDAAPEEYLQHFQINAVGPLTLFKALLPLLRQTENKDQKGKFIAISSAAGSTELMLSKSRGGALPYAMSKAALNHCINKLRFEFSEVAFRILTPGATRTEFGNEKVDWSKMPHALSVEEVVPQLMDRIDEFVDNPKDTNVEFRDWKGDVVPW